MPSPLKELIPFLSYFTVPVGGRFPRTAEDIRDLEYVQCQPGVLLPSPCPDLDFGGPGLEVIVWHFGSGWLITNIHFFSSHGCSGSRYLKPRQWLYGKPQNFFFSLYTGISGCLALPVKLSYQNPRGPSSLICNMG